MHACSACMRLPLTELLLFLLSWAPLAGRTHTLSFKSVRPEHAGEIRFTAERVSSYATLTVTGEPAAFSDSRVRSWTDLPSSNGLSGVFSQSCRSK